ncbi:hypothetical protein NQ314_015148 [Rhamnusium bicolor]|uniref:Uncharacterized protein n=1 Tax=Rhamnusium bicolor TaxID=1586634 RepID=A0AAV8X028_9CUCU|nr:hypothetical protein NQ314_015148 [Rhamnusium bicolor]
MYKQGLPPPHCLPAMNLPSNRGASTLRQRPIPSRGGQLQVAGVVVGSWGANYGFQPNMRHQVMPGGGYPPQGRGRGGGGGGGGGGPSGNYQNNYGRGRGQNRKPGPPTFPVNQRRNQVSFYFILFIYYFFFFGNLCMCLFLFDGYFVRSSLYSSR